MISISEEFKKYKHQWLERVDQYYKQKEENNA